MKRAWPYALALAVVVTGCYLALAPLLRSLSPGSPTPSATPLLSSSTTTVGLTKVATLVGSSGNHGFTSLLIKAKKAKKAKTPALVAQTPVFVQSPTSSTTSTSSSSSTTAQTSTTAKPKTTTKTASNTTSRLPRQVGGTINQADNGGFAGQSSGDSTLPGGKSSTLAGG